MDKRLIKDRARKVAAALCIGLLSWGSVAAAKLPVNLQAVLIAKVLSYESALAQKPSLSLYAVDAPELLEKLQVINASPAIDITFSKLHGGEGFPTEPYDLLYLSSVKDFQRAKNYIDKYRVLVITDDEAVVREGAVLGLILEAGKPRVLLNLHSSQAIGLQWDNVLLKIVKAYY